MIEVNMQNDTATASGGSVRIAGEHGYRIEGDTAFLNVELEVQGDEAQRTAWALQLWACEQPHSSGPIAGIKIAEVPIELPPSPDAAPLHLRTEGFAQLPARQRPYSMVLVLASGLPGAFEQVHDFANYANREFFLVPHFDGEASYSIQGESAVLRAERISNPRLPGSLSGSLVLELWAVAEPGSSEVLQGAALARAELGQLMGQSALEQLEREVPLSLPPAGEWRVVLALREWTAAGFVTRDFCDFPIRFQRALDATEAAARHDAIALAAYYRYVARGKQSGAVLQDWLDAERELNTVARSSLVPVDFARS